MEQEGYTHLIKNTGYLFLKMPQEIISEIKTSVDVVQNDFNKSIPLNDRLAGQIDKEYAIKLTHKATQYIKWTVEQYCNANPNYINSITNHPVLKYEGDAWINFQEKYEYNPMHDHTGVFSYVIWYQIPFYKEDEIKYGAGKGKEPKKNNNGDFVFKYPVGDKIYIHSLSIDKTKEGYMAVFPSSLNHAVYPFYTSDDYRITVSGNVLLQDR